MFGLRYLLQTSTAAYKAYSEVLRVFRRNQFLNSKFTELQGLIVGIFNAVRRDTKPADSIEVVAILARPSLDARVDGRTDADTSVALCVSSMLSAEVQQLYEDDNIEWFEDCGIGQIMHFDAITIRDYETCVTVFRQSQWAQSLSSEIVELIAIEYDTAAKTCFLAIWYTAGMRPEWVHDGVNTTSDSELCLADAIAQFDRMCDETVEESRE